MTRVKIVQRYEAFNALFKTSAEALRYAHRCQLVDELNKGVDDEADGMSTCVLLERIERLPDLQLKLVQFLIDVIDPRAQTLADLPSGLREVVTAMVEMRKRQ